MFRNPLADGVVVIFIVLLFFGPKRLPMMGKSIGEGIREFKSGIGGSSEEETPPAITQAPAAPAAAQHDTADSERSL
jgi:sec-independent protein translocase protein TatA